MTSWYYGKQFAEKAVVLKHKEEKQRQEEQRLAASYQTLSGMLSPDAARIDLTTAFSDLLIAIMANRVENGIVISSVTPHKNPGNSGVAETTRLRELVPGTSVGSIRVNVRGNYATFDGLTHYLQALRTHPVSVTYLKVEERNFELGLRVYGN